MAPVALPNSSLGDKSISTGVLVVTSITAGVLLITLVEFLHRLGPKRLETNREWLRMLFKDEIPNVDLIREELYRLDRFCTGQQKDGQAGQQNVDQADQLESSRAAREQAREMERRKSARELEVENVRMAGARYINLVSLAQDLLPYPETMFPWRNAEFRAAYFDACRNVRELKSEVIRVRREFRDTEQDLRRKAGLDEQGEGADGSLSEGKGQDFGLRPRRKRDGDIVRDL